MKLSKAQLRLQIELGMPAFLTDKQITQCPVAGKKRDAKSTKEEVVEIEVEHLPEELRKKYFVE